MYKGSERMNQIDHIAIAVFSIQKTACMFSRLFNWEFSDIEVLPNQGVKVSFASLGNLHIELIEPMSNHSTLHTFLTKRGEGLHHIALKSGDIQADLSQLDELGIQLIQRTHKMVRTESALRLFHQKKRQVCYLNCVRH